MNITVNSSNGTLTMNGCTGEVINCLLDDDGDPLLKNIYKFDVDEWRAAHPNTKLPCYIDILDLGYWFHPFGCSSFTDAFMGREPTTYEPPAHDWRELIASFN